MIKKAVMLASIMVLSIGISFATSNPETEITENDTYAMITGNVVDSNTGEAIPNATIQIASVEKTVTTDENGTFAFDQIATGEHTLTVEAEGYQKVEKAVNVTEGSNTIKVKVSPEM
jgi:hypothetical protein